MDTKLDGFDLAVATAIIGVDTLWGGDVNNPSGTGRFIADSYFSGKDLPPCYHHPIAVKLREGNEGVLGDKVTDDEIMTFLKDIEHPRSLFEMDTMTDSFRSDYIRALSRSMRVMVDMALAFRGIGDPVPFETAVMASTGQLPKLYDVSEMRQRIFSLMEFMGQIEGSNDGQWQAVQAWRAKNLIPKGDIAAYSADIIAKLNALMKSHMDPLLPGNLTGVPRTNVRFMPIDGAWFSGSLNYLGRNRLPNGNPEYEATYEINSALEISGPEFWHLISHEVCPGHIMNYAILHFLYHTGAPRFGFEATIQTMNSRASTLAEGIANNAILFACGVDSISQIDVPELQLGVLLSQLQDYAKANIAYRLHGINMDPNEVEKITREECLLSEERAKKLTHSWGNHPLLGKMYLPSYAVGTEAVARMIKDHGRAKVIPVIYGAHGMVDIVTAQQLIETM